jgi:hypothetical protein
MERNMKTILSTLVGISLLALFGLTDQTDAASTRQRGYTTYCHGTPDQCMRGYRAKRQARGYLPARQRTRSYDFPRFGTQRWWQLQEDQD